MFRPLTTQLVGSYAKPAWLTRPTRMYASDGSWWRPDLDVLNAARADAARLAIADQERAGLDLLTDGEQWRQNYASHFYTRLLGVDATRFAAKERTSTLATVTRRVESIEETALRNRAPRIVGELGWPGPLAVDELRFLKRQTRKPVKATVVGPLTALYFLKDEHYGDEERAAMALAAVLNRELRALDAEGADLLQVDEPCFHTQLAWARRFGVAALNRMVEGVRTPVVVHACYGYAYYVEHKEANPAYAECLTLLAACDIWGMSIEYEQPGHTPDLLTHCGDKHVVLGLLDLGTEETEAVAHVATRLREALAVVPPERLHPAPDCGMWHLPRDVAFAKLRALVLGAETLRNERGLP